MDDRRPPPDSDLTPLRVLLLEDVEDDALLLIRELKQGGYDVIHRRVDRQQDFLAAMREQTWDVVLSDYSMPSFNGLTAFALMRERGFDHPFIFVSGHIGEERAVEAMRQGVSDYITKDRLARLVPAVQRELRDAETRRREREMSEALRASEERLRRLTQNAPDIIYEYAFTPLPHFAYVSPAVEAITGYSVAEHYADPELWLTIVHPDDRDTLAARLQPRVAFPGSADLLRWTDRSGRQRWVEQRTVPVYVDGRLVGVEGIVRDVTERRELEEQLLAAQRMEAIGRLAGGIAHDFNNMLTVIGGYCSLLRRKLPEMDARLRDLARIENATERATALVRQLLAFSRRQPRHLRLLDLNSVLRDLAPLIRRLIGEHIHVDMRGTNAEAIVRADRSQLEQIVMNLVVNAGDAMPDGGRLVIRTEPVDTARLPAPWPDHPPAGGYACLTVADTGMGIDPDVQAHIFEPFFTTKEVGKGTGLGLSTVYGIVKQMEGEIRVESRPDEGARFHVYLPRATEQPESARPQEDDGSPAGSGTILLVEDEEMVREAAEEILTAHGYRIVTAADGESALEVARGMDFGIDLLLTDLVMPGIGGLELGQRLLQHLPDLPLLYMTGYAEISPEHPSSPAPPEQLLQKPFDSGTLLRRVREALARRTRTP